jgi:sugar phosphate isomerase/epimerase
MNEIKESEVIREIGPERFNEVTLLNKWLRSPNPKLENWSAGDYATNGALSYRRSPSIITRSEAELFGVSLPRFASRIYLRQDQTEFVNARRIVVFADQARHWAKRRGRGSVLGVRPLKRGEMMPGNRFRRSLKCPGWILHTNSCVADSVLQIPDRFREDFHIITSPVWRLYGRTDAGTEFWGTPYIKHIPLSGGGLCAQAVCFMATVLMIEEASAIYGIAEISKLAMGPRAKDFLLTGLSPKHLATYFSEVELELHSQSPSDHQGLQFAMKAYLISNCPIIFPVDAGIFHGHLPIAGNNFVGIIESNNIPRKPMDREIPRGHAVVVLGYGGDYFILHDPGSCPFVQATTAQLWDAGRYTAHDRARQLSGNFFAVTPNAAKLPIADSGRAEQGEFKITHVGLLTLAQCILDRYQAKIIEETEFIKLVHLSEAALILEGKANELESSELRELVRVEFKGLLRQNQNETLVWLQGTTQANYLIWDAEKAPRERGRCSREDATTYLHLHISRSGGTWATVYRRDTSTTTAGRIDGVCSPSTAGKEVVSVPSPEERLVPRERGHLQRSLLTSFAVGIGKATSGWPKEWRWAEKYMLMQRESEYICKGAVLSSLLLREVRQFLRYTVFVIGNNMYRRHPLVRWFHPYTLARKYRRLPTKTGRYLGFGWTWPKSTALERLAALHNDARALRRLAEVGSTSVGAPVIAFATFFPEISSVDPKTRQKVGLALKTLCRLAGILNKKHLHKIGIIEVVGGSLVEGIWPGISNSGAGDETEYVASVLDEREGIDRVVEVLCAVADEAIKANVRLAIELEPGPLYIIRNLKTLELFCERISNEKLLSDCVGLNLDIAHWQLAGMKPSDIPESIKERIIHCHACDAFKGHCIDLPAGSSNGRRLLADWLDLLPPGYVTCELEGCPNETWLATAFENLTAVGLT